MNSVTLNSLSNGTCLNESLVELINSKIKFVDSKLKKFMASLMKGGQTPGQAPIDNTISVEAQTKVFDTIENSSLQTTKLLYLRANATSYNTSLILQLISSSDLEAMSLDEIKKKIKL